jgi:hypothetical protein
LLLACRCVSVWADLVFGDRFGSAITSPMPVGFSGSTSPGTSSCRRGAAARRLWPRRR